MKIKAVIFDIGNVLVQDPDIAGFWGGSEESVELRDAFGTGKISEEEFIEGGAKVFGISKEEFRDRYVAAYVGNPLKEDVYQIFTEIKVPKYIFSDTNPILWQYVKDELPQLIEGVEKSYASQEIGCRKKSKESYELILEDLGLDPSEIVFIDNKKKYTDAFSEFGVHGVHFTTAKKLREDLEKVDSSLFTNSEDE